MKTKKKKLMNEKNNVIAVYLYQDGVLASANIGERGVISIEMNKGSALLKTENDQTITIPKEEVQGVAIKEKKGNTLTFAINQSGHLMKTINEDKYEKEDK